MGSNLRRRGGVYWFRRRIPDALRARVGRVEINRSLHTRCFRTAAERARWAWLRTEALFQEMSYKSVSAEQAELIVRRLLREPLWQSPTAAELAAAVGADDDASLDIVFRHATEILPTLSTEERQRLLHSLERLLEKAELREAHRTTEAAHLKAEVHELRAVMAALGEARADRASRAAAAAAAKAQVDLIVERRVTERLAATTSPQPASPQAAAAPAPVITAPVEVLPSPSPQPLNNDASGVAPLLSARIERFFEAKRYPPHTKKQNRTTIRLWMETVGDRRTDSYTEEDAYAFQTTLRQMPASHGKGRPMTAPELVAATRGQRIPRLSEKTIERHFSLLRQLWLHLGKRIADQSIFDGIEHKVVDGERSPWTEGPLDRLLRARWNPTNRRGNRVSEETHAWIVGIGGYTGARAEEIARLRVKDVQEVDGTWFFIIRTQEAEEDKAGEGGREWMTKTPAGERAVAIHPRLLAAGILEWVERRRAAGAERLFDLAASGPNRNLAAEYSREFSRHKIALRIPGDIVFHSFRHNVETILGNKEVKQVWVDTMLGHKHERPGAARKSVGLKVYFHGLATAALREVAYAVEYPEHICPLLLLRRVRGEVPW